MARLLGRGVRHASGIIWSANGVGYYSVNADPYDQAYFNKYRVYGRTDLGTKLNTARVNFVSRHYWQSLLCDVGIGCGSFIEMRWELRRQLTLGYDINPAAVAWLKDHGLLIDPYRCKLPALCLWDCLEHIGDFVPLVANCRQWLFLSLPIFRDREHAEKSKHFRRDEHFWYFTAAGLIFVMDKLGFDLMAQNNMETQLGREDIGSFAFRRKEI